MTMREFEISLPGRGVFKTHTEEADDDPVAAARGVVRANVPAIKARQGVAVRYRDVDPVSRKSTEWKEVAL